MLKTKPVILTISASSTILELFVKETKNTSIVIAWEKNFDVFNKVTQYIVETEVVKTYAASVLNKMSWSVQADLNEYELLNLHPATTYAITLISLQGSELINNLTIEGQTVVGIPFPKPDEPIILSESDSTKTIEIGGNSDSTYHNINGPLSAWRVVVHIVDGDLYQNFEPLLLKNFQEASEEGIPFYITGELENRTKTFTVGDGKVWGGFENPPLPPNKHIHISVGVVSTIGNVTEVIYSDTTHDQHSLLELSTLPTILVENGTNQTLIIILATGCIIFGILLIGSIVTYCFLRVLASRRRRNTRLSNLNLELSIQTHNERQNNGFVAENFSTGTFLDNLNMLVEKLDDNQKIQRKNLTLDIDHIVASGVYGDVIQGNVTKNKISTQAQVHIISDDMEKNDQKVFLKEFSDLLEIRGHQSFLYFMGVCQTTDWFYLVFEHIEKTLKSFLLESRSSSTDKFSLISEDFVLNTITDLCTAMEYLEKNQILHKKLNSYNVRVNQDDECKLLFFGPTHFTENGKNINIERWYAPEVLKSESNYTSKSDIYSFGLLMWEFCTLGGTPFINVANSDLLARITRGARPEQPPFIYDDLYQLFLNCWELDARERPTFEEINLFLKQLTSSSLEHTLSFKKRNDLVLPYHQPSLEIQH